MNNDIESLRQILEQNERIIEILGGASSIISDLYVINNNNDFDRAVNYFFNKKNDELLY